MNFAMVAWSRANMSMSPLPPSPEAWESRKFWQNHWDNKMFFAESLLDFLVNHFIVALILCEWRMWLQGLHGNEHWWLNEKHCRADYCGYGLFRTQGSSRRRRGGCSTASQRTRSTTASEAAPRRPGTNCIKIGLAGELTISKRKGLWEVLFSSK